jgi:hypothetical protein
MPKEQNGRPEPDTLLRVIATDIHFWIPLLVLLAGLVLLRELR